ncbi:MAG: hypothetical protein P1V35_09450 [Planctomycetota bacterium]|nr:hypothetical protein [Planctomycetota bacterium]
MNLLSMRMPALIGGSLLLCASAMGQSRYATSIVSFNQGAGTGIFDTSLILGGPRGGAGTHVLTLGSGGDVTLGFDRTITNGPGADFVVFENTFEWMSNTFPEVAMVEVSTNGVDFARFPMRYDGPHDFFAGSFDMTPWGSYSGVTGHVPPLANVDTNVLSPFNPMEGGGEGFDLADLSDHVLVLGGMVDLNAIHYIRLVDLEAGAEVDSRLVTVFDSGGALGNADIDSVAVVHDTLDLDPTGPVLDFHRDDLGYVWLELTDPNGFGDLNLATLRLSANLVETPFYRLRDFFILMSATNEGIILRSPLPMYLQDFHMVLAASVEDMSGNKSVDQISLNR